MASYNSVTNRGRAHLDTTTIVEALPLPARHERGEGWTVSPAAQVASRRPVYGIYL